MVELRRRCAKEFDSVCRMHDDGRVQCGLGVGSLCPPYTVNRAQLTACETASKLKLRAFKLRAFLVADLGCRSTTASPGSRWYASRLAPRPRHDPGTPSPHTPHSRPRPRPHNHSQLFGGPCPVVSSASLRVTLRAQIRFTYAPLI
eukprot:scaffold18217_cov58-Phaeocystis_antarctica.AAC.1